eukprot:195800_1
MASLHCSKQKKKVCPAGGAASSGDANDSRYSGNSPNSSTRTSHEKDGEPSLSSTNQPQGEDAAHKPSPPLVNNNSKKSPATAMISSSAPLNRQRKDPTALSWNRCSWASEHHSFDNDATAANEEGEEECGGGGSGSGSLYHVLDDSTCGCEGEESWLDVSESKRLSLLDVLREDELSFKKSFPRAA